MATCRVFTAAAAECSIGYAIVDIPGKVEEAVEPGVARAFGVLNLVGTHLDIVTPARVGVSALACATNGVVTANEKSSALPKSGIVRVKQSALGRAGHASGHAAFAPGAYQTTTFLAELVGWIRSCAVLPNVDVVFIAVGSLTMSVDDAGIVGEYIQDVIAAEGAPVSLPRVVVVFVDGFYGVARAGASHRNVVAYETVERSVCDDECTLSRVLSGYGAHELVFLKRPSGDVYWDATRRVAEFISQRIAKRYYATSCGLPAAEHGILSIKIPAWWRVVAGKNPVPVGSFDYAEKALGVSRAISQRGPDAKDVGYEHSIPAPTILSRQVAAEVAYSREIIGSRHAEVGMSLLRTSFSQTEKVCSVSYEVSTTPQTALIVFEDASRAPLPRHLGSDVGDIAVSKLDLPLTSSFASELLQYRLPSRASYADARREVVSRLECVDSGEGARAATVVLEILRHLTVSGVRKWATFNTMMTGEIGGARQQ